ncbi:hypothetical protein M011DRAFT_473141 [Sporormia fimetaria CBS 119925]|uniref:Hpc2-related domain-containing protein n=1 Tax=Sporormia fimetaria CBS 119925 TaxID=1340428 RepID=A0A6A6VRI5_9PLEO|nr:hypothetical protein M011DRAFT_473141 [Sporormia fimetaria CBS 119925]
MASAASSPGSLSSPPHSPDNGHLSNKGGVAAPDTTSSPHPGSTTTTPRLTASGQPRKKPGPKPKPKDPNAPEKKTRKPRKPAEPKDAAAEPAPRKRRAKASLDAATEDKSAQQQAAPAAQQTAHPTEGNGAHPGTVPRSTEPIHANPNLSHMTAPPTTPRPASSGQRYDPIRGELNDSHAHVAPTPISPPVNRASASPSIKSLIDPPGPATTHSLYPQVIRSQQQSVTSAPSVNASRVGPPLPHPEPHQATSSASASFAAPATTTSMELDDAPSQPRSVPMKKTSSTGATPSTSNAPTPPVKAARQKEAPPPLPTGSGLLSGTPFGPATTGSTNTESQGVNIWLKVDLNDPCRVNTINFAQEVEKRYGFAALHPKIAARRERLRQVTAAGAALEKAAGAGSNDDMSLDLSEPESNVEMGGMEDEGSAAGNGVKKRRKRKQEDYDKEDDFIDDAELQWQSQALMVKDGFFVYSGPLIQEGEKPAIERADGTTKRGRGRGRGGSTRGETSGRGRGRGGGPGSRGGNTVRKPRVTKADRAQMEQEKLQREKMAQTMGGKQPMQYPTSTL